MVTEMYNEAFHPIAVHSKQQQTSAYPQQTFAAECNYSSPHD
jgi:hypothetical protein